MEARLVKQSKYTPARFREVGVREIGRIGSILFVRTHSPLVLIHVSALADRLLDGYGVEQAKAMIEQGASMLTVARDLGVCESSLRAQLKSHGWRPMSRQDGGPKAGANVRLDAARKHRTRGASS